MAVGTIKLHVINHDSPFFFSTLSRSTKFRIPDVTVLFSVRCPVQQNCMVPGVTVPFLSTLSRWTELYGTRRDCPLSQYLVPLNRTVWYQTWLSPFSVPCPVEQNCMVPGVTVPSLSTLSRSTKHMVPDVTVPFLSNLSLSTEFYGTRRDCHFSITCPVQRNSMVLGVAVPFLSTLSRSTKFYRVPRFPYTRN